MDDILLSVKNKLRTDDRSLQQKVSKCVIVAPMSPKTIRKMKVGLDMVVLSAAGARGRSYF